MPVMDPFCPSGIQTILHWSSSRRFHDIASCSRTQENGLLRSHTVYSKRQCMVADLLRRAVNSKPNDRSKSPELRSRTLTADRDDVTVGLSQVPHDDH